MYDYYLGGKDNFEADRLAAQEIMRLRRHRRRAAPTGARILATSSAWPGTRGSPTRSAASGSPIGWRTLARKPFT